MGFAGAGAFRLSDLERDCPSVGREWIRNVLAQMRDEGELTCTGRGVAARWRAVEKGPQDDRPRRSVVGRGEGLRRERPGRFHSPGAPSIFFSALLVRRMPRRLLRTVRGT
jgi:hypothetical protein